LYRIKKKKIGVNDLISAQESLYLLELNS